MRKIDAFAHILPRAYLARLEQQLEQTMAPSQLAYYREGVFYLRSGADRPGRALAEDRAVRRVCPGPGAGRATA